MPKNNAPPVCKVLRTMLPPRTRARAAKVLGLDLRQLRAVLDGHAPITPAIAERLPLILPNQPAEMWNRMQARYDADQIALPSNSR